MIERAVITSVHGELQVELPKDTKSLSEQPEVLEEVERRHILKVLEDTLWRIEGPIGAAKRLNLKPSTLRNRMKKYRIKRPQP